MYVCAYCLETITAVDGEWVSYDLDRASHYVNVCWKSPKMNRNHYPIV